MLLSGTEHSGLRVECFPDHRFLMVAVGLIGAILPRVEHVKIRQPPVRTAAIERHVRPLRKRPATQRHEFVVGLIGIHPAGQKFLRRDAFFFRDEVRVVVVKLVVIPRHEPWKEPVRIGQHRVQPVLRVARAILIQCLDLPAQMLARPVVGAAVLINVIAQVHDEVEILLLHVRVAVEVAALKMLA